MPGFMLHVGASVQCTHAATATAPPTQTRVLVGGQPVLTSSAQLSVAGCPFQIPIGTGTKPQPCVSVQWLLLSARVLLGGQPALLQPAPGSGSALCKSAEQIPQGPPVVGSLQTRVSAS